MCWGVDLVMCDGRVIFHKFEAEHFRCGTGHDHNNVGLSCLWIEILDGDQARIDEQDFRYILNIFVIDLFVAVNRTYGQV